MPPVYRGTDPAQWGQNITIMHPEGAQVWNGGGRAALWRFATPNKQHPTQKPVELIGGLLMDFTQPDQTILDLHGFRHNRRCCRQNGRKFIGIEIGQKYFDIARRRMLKPL